ncbi:MAG: transporter substrate-binding domain-containing protein [Balneola sp.]|nr:transporter substrate-binding domain-containing protein [Balneola sp.]MBO6650596.1 transporter substrate-binding domain-containing protein [Balneola sp.]MBO6712625.1 transporter substrate-binding domain-containing protein [Balneola sp.]MBO6800881.1 transporter substrate-binding domain-containing protein [Balneola sp.]MBO6870554.1 transporter substrate-binding domain-containing protein [Balneola sp.]
MSKNNLSVGENSGSKWILVVLTIACLSISCTETQEIPKETPSTLATITEPVERDYAEIKNTGILRVITSYSSSTYFLHRGIQAGFEYELIKNFAKEHELALEVIIIGENENPYDLLNSGEGDLIAASYTITEERKEVVDFTRPYNLVDQIIVLSEELGQEPESITDLSSIPITVRRNSSYYVKLKELQDKGFDLTINVVSDDMDTEALLFQVANGTYSATVADDNFFQASNKYMDGLVKGPMIAENDTIAWAVRKNAPDLITKFNKYLYKHFRFNNEGVPKRSAFLNVLRKKYFEGSTPVADYFTPDIEVQRFGGISPYDSLLQTVASEFDLDWVMLTSIAAQESKFDPNSESWAGAVGIMQVLPRFSEIPLESLYDPEINIREGARILKEQMDHYSYMDSTSQWQFALATYNAGPGHVADARRLAIDHNDDPNEWESVSKALLRLMQRKYYQHARYGFCRGIETVRYVNEITNRSNTYEAILALSQSRNDSYPGVLGFKTIN